MDYVRRQEEHVFHRVVKSSDTTNKPSVILEETGVALAGSSENNAGEASNSTSIMNIEKMQQIGSISAGSSLSAATKN